MLNKLKGIYERRYKALLIITIAFLLFSCGVLALHKVQTGEFISKDVSIKGGVLVTINTDKALDLDQTEKALAAELGTSVSIKQLQGFGTTGLGYSFTVEPMPTETVLNAISKVTGLELTQGMCTVEEVSSGLGATFWTEILKAIGFAFAFMSIVIVLYFRKAVPSFAVILCGISNLVGTLAIMDLIHMKLSVGGVAALLMIIGYSIDTDILLSTRMLKRTTEGSDFERMLSSVKTGMTMELTAIAALSVLFIVSPAEILKQISLLLIIGLVLDIPNTWIQNGGIMRWYLERKHGKA